MRHSFARTFAEGGDLSRWTNDTHFTSPAPGCLQVTTTRPTHKLLLSCGIHGDETAPIEMLDRLIEDIRSDILTPTIDILFVVGNPNAIQAGKRFLDQDMNRLFDGAWKQKDKLNEAQRAHELEKVTRSFFATDESMPRWHLDLHTTIRPSWITRFGIANAATKAELSSGLLNALYASSLGAIVLNPRSRGTYSAFSSHLPGVASLTLELGQGMRFGENTLDTTAPLEGVLRCLIEGKPVPTPSEPEPLWFEATREIIRSPERFALHLSDATENFTRLEPGQLLADTDEGSICADPGEAILFPNPNVAPGLRAGLLVRLLPS